MEQKGMMLIGNGLVVTRDLTNPLIPNGGVLIEGSHIKKVGITSELTREFPEADYLDAKGQLIMPGYINAHQHIYSAFARGMSIPGNEPRDFMDILEGTWWKLDRHLSLEATYYSAMVTYMEGIRNGVTTVIDHHASYGAIGGSLEQIAKAAKELGVRTCLAYEISDRDGIEQTKAALEESIEFDRAVAEAQDGMLKDMIGLHASFTLSDETLKQVRSANVLGTGYHIHVAEGAHDYEEAYANYGMSVVERLIHEGILNDKSVAGHCIHVSEDDMDLLKKAGVTVVHNPQSNMSNGVGCPDVLSMFDRGLKVCLGTDGYTNDMLESAKTAMILQKHHGKNPSRGFVEAVDMLFYQNPVLASRIFQEQVGILKEGALADIIIVEYNPFTPLNQDNINGHILFGMTGSNTLTTIINGKLRMKDRQILDLDLISIYEKSREVSEKLWRELYD